jgi:hypothetical protein
MEFSQSGKNASITKNPALKRRRNQRQPEEEDLVSILQAE